MPPYEISWQPNDNCFVVSLPEFKTVMQPVFNMDSLLR